MDNNAQNSSGMSQTKSDGLAIDFSALADSAKAKLGEIGEPVKDKALEVASQQKDAGADQLQVASRAIHGAARELENAMPQFAGYIHEVGSWLEQAASDIRGNSIDGMMSRLGEFGRNQPAIVFGGAMVAGIALSRFLKSSAPSNVGSSNTGMNQMTSSNMSGMQSGPRTLQSGAGTNMRQGGISGGSQGGVSGSSQNGMGSSGQSGTGGNAWTKPGGSGGELP